MYSMYKMPKDMKICIYEARTFDKHVEIEFLRVKNQMKRHFEKHFILFYNTYGVFFPQ